jgi:hypothetical protein
MTHGGAEDMLADFRLSRQNGGRKVDFSLLRRLSEPPNPCFIKPADRLPFTI